jgi:hypothetical protein
MTAANPLLVPSLWAALRAAEGPASIAELQRTTPGRHHHIKARLRLWADAGLVHPLPPLAVRFAIAPAHAKLEAAPSAGGLSGIAWQALRRMGRPATLQELVQASGQSDRALYCRIFRWIRTGHVVRIDPEPERFVLTPEALEVEEPPRIHRSKPRKKTTARSRIWSAMRILKHFDVPMLVMTAEVNRRACEDFISALVRAGYVRVIAHRVVRRKPGNHGFARYYSSYQLVRSSGPKCPVICCPKDAPKFLLDRNSGKRFDLPRRTREARNGQ